MNEKCSDQLNHFILGTFQIYSAMNLIPRYLIKEKDFFDRRESNPTPLDYVSSALTIEPQPDDVRKSTLCKLFYVDYC